MEPEPAFFKDVPVFDTVKALFSNRLRYRSLPKMARLRSSSTFDFFRAYFTPDVYVILT